MLEFPLFCKVTINEPLLPSVTVPKGRLVGLAPSCVLEDTPVPLRPIASGEFGALLTRESDPFTAPATVGAKTTLNVMFPPAAIVFGMESPVALNPAPVILAAVIVTLALPPFNSMTVCELLLPTVTFPRLALPGFAESSGCGGAVPVPLMGIARGEPGAL